MKSTKEVQQFVERVNELYPFIGKGRKREYADIRTCVFVIAYNETRNPNNLDRGFVKIKKVAKVIGMSHANIYTSLRKWENLYNIYPEFTELYDKIKALI